MQSADDMQFGDAQRQRLARLPHNFVHGQLEAILVPFFPGERTELTAQDAVIGVVDVAIEDIAGATGVLALVHEVRDRAHGVQVFAFEQPKSLGVGNPLACHDLVIDIAQLAALKKKAHRTSLNGGNTTSVTTTIKKN